MKYTVLSEILARVQERISADKLHRPVNDLKKRISDTPPAASFSDSLRGAFGLIAEIKRRSPSQGSMRHQEIEDVARKYQEHSFVRAVSVLTNRDHFDMRIEDLEHMRSLITKPILRKDFIFDEYQVYEARAFGADAILLMANVLTDRKKMQGLFDLSRQLGMDVLFECRDKSEIDAIPSGAKIYGINSRKLKAKQFFGISLRYTFSKWFKRVIPDKSIEYAVFDLVNHIPKHSVKVAESGLVPREINLIRDKYQYNSALVGTAILNAPEGVTAALDAFSGCHSESRINVNEGFSLTPTTRRHPLSQKMF